MHQRHPIDPTRTLRLFAQEVLPHRTRASHPTAVSDTRAHREFERTPGQSSNHLCPGRGARAMARLAEASAPARQSSRQRDPGGDERSSSKPAAVSVGRCCGLADVWPGRGRLVRCGLARRLALARLGPPARGLPALVIQAITADGVLERSNVHIVAGRRGDFDLGLRPAPFVVGAVHTLCSVLADAVRGATSVYMFPGESVMSSRSPWGSSTRRSSPRVGLRQQRSLPTCTRVTAGGPNPLNETGATVGRRG